MKIPPKNLLDAINDNRNALYVWVPVNKEERRSIRISYDAAIEWSFAVAAKHNGVVPFFIGTNEVFLGSVLQYL